MQIVTSKAPKNVRNANSMDIFVKVCSIRISYKIF